MTTATRDRIEKEIDVPGAPGRVWSLLTDPREFGQLFHLKTEAAVFRPGESVRWAVTHPSYEGVTGEMVVDQMTPEKTFSWRWHPYAVERNVDYSSEPMTRVVFRLRPEGDGTRVSLVESGFDALPSARRGVAFRANEEGWTQVLASLERAAARL